MARPVKVVVQPASIPAPPPSRPSGVRLTRRGRLLVSCLTVALALGMFLVGRAFPGSAADGAVAASPATPVASVVVQPGDTLWGLAVRIAPDSDPRRTVDMLRNLNRLDSGQLSVGQTLRVPVAP